jgi:hypothetical protein
VIPDLAFIVGAYVIVRLVALVARQFPGIESRRATRVVIASLAGMGIALTIFFALDTLGHGLESDAESQRLRNRLEFDRKQLESTP